MQNIPCVTEPRPQPKPLLLRFLVGSYFQCHFVVLDVLGLFQSPLLSVWRGSHIEHIFSGILTKFSTYLLLHGDERELLTLRGLPIPIPQVALTIGCICTLQPLPLLGHIHIHGEVE